MFITFEGIEGAGKGTLLHGVERWLSQRGSSYVLTREPGGSDLGKKLRALLLDTRSMVFPRAELFLYLADRSQHVREVILPALQEGKIVLSDRYADSTIVYQGWGRNLEVASLLRMNELALEGLWPDLTVLIDLPPSVGLARARKRNAELGLEEKEGRFEAEALPFHERIRHGYLEWAKKNKERFFIIDGEKSPEVLVALIVERMQYLGI